jgi:DNA (cytosine-5)-methyltransferase 1
MIKVGSDFSGIGSFNQALNMLGVPHEHVFACDMDRYARRSYIDNYLKEGVEVLTNLSKAMGYDQLNHGEHFYFPKNVYDRQIPIKPLDVYMTSPPCQAFSIAGKRGGEHDERGILFYNSHEFIKKNKPRFFIFENVKGLLSHSKDKNDKTLPYGQTFNKWLQYLGGKSINGNPVMFPIAESVPYHIYYKVLNATDYGLPQNRERVFIIGIRDDKDNRFRWPKPFPLTKRLIHVLEDHVDEKYFLSDKMLNYLHNRKDNFNSGKINYKDENDIASCINSSSKSLDISDNIIKSKSKKEVGFKFLPISVNDIGSCITVKEGQNRQNNFLKIKSALDTSCNQGVMVQAGRMIGRNPENPKSRKPGEVNVQTIEINEDPNVSNCLTTVQKDNMVIQLNPQLIQAGQLTGGKWDKTHQQSGRYYNPEGLSPTIHTMGGGNQEPKILNHDFRIRRLTPRECLRLMGFPDDFKIVVSDTQAYKQAGNSIVTKVLYHLLNTLPL